MTDTQQRIGRLRWRSRRGMKELDKLLEAYFKADLSSCDEATITSLERLLECQDPQLLDWLLGRSTPPDAQLNQIIKRILQAGDPAWGQFSHCSTRRDT